jgi:hypothetical protein
MGVLDRLRQPGWLRRALFALGLLLALIIIIRVLLDPIAAHFTHKQLNASEAVSGDFESVHVTLLPPGYGIRRIKIIEAQGGDWLHPLFYAEHARVTLDWRRLLHAELAARLRLDGPKMVMTATGGKGGKKIPDIGAALEKVIPARVDRVEVREGEFLYRDVTAPRHPEFWLHDIELAAENLTTRKRLAGGRPATVSARATLGKSGTVTFFASADLFAAKPEFAGQLALRGWRVAELYDLEEPATKLQTPKGTLDLFAEFKARDGTISGGVKPVLRNVEVRPTEDGFGNKLKAWIADKGLRLFSDRVPGRNAAATVIPIQGRLDQPDVQIWPTILGVLRNAFVEGISAGFAHLPPPASPEKESVLTQATHALQKDKGPPKAQPPKIETGSDKK